LKVLAPPLGAVLVLVRALRACPVCVCVFHVDSWVVRGWPRARPSRAARAQLVRCAAVEVVNEPRPPRRDTGSAVGTSPAPGVQVDDVGGRSWRTVAPAGLELARELGHGGPLPSLTGQLQGTRQGGLHR